MNETLDAIIPSKFDFETVQKSGPKVAEKKAYNILKLYIFYITLYEKILIPFFEVLIGKEAVAKIVEQTINNFVSRYRKEQWKVNYDPALGSESICT